MYLYHILMKVVDDGGFYECTSTCVVHKCVTILQCLTVPRIPNGIMMSTGVLNALVS